jgi:rSAM/selenodomain-associated transferase 2
VNGRSERRLKFSLIIPSWNDADNLAALLPSLRKIDNPPEIVVVDATQDRQSEQITVAAGAIFISSSNANRGEQLNRGARAATGDVLIFHHADTQLHAAHLARLEAALEEAPEVIGGAFYRKFDRRHPHLDFLERAARFLNQHGGTFYGDQSVFVRREIFFGLGGFATIPLMEDVEFSRRLRGAGKTIMLDPPLESSARRHLQKGPWRTTIQNGFLILLYKLGVSPHRLHRWYYVGHASTTSPGKLGPEPITSE